MRPLRALLFFAAVLLAAAGAAQAQPTITIASVVASSSYLPLWIAQDQKLFEKHGLAVEVRNVTAPHREIGRGAQFGVVSIPGILAAAAEGQDVRIVMPLDLPRITALFVARPGLHSPEQLAGARIGVPSVGSGAWVTTSLAFDYFGMDPARSGVRYVELGNGSAAAVRALEAGTIDAAVLDAGQAAPLRARGFPVVLDFGTTSISGVQSALAVDAKFAKENPQVVEKVIAALLDGLAFGLAPGNEPRVKEILGRTMNLAGSPSALETGYRSFLYRANRRPLPSLEATQRLQSVMARADAKYAGVEVTTLLDASFVRRLEERGEMQRFIIQHAPR